MLKIISISIHRFRSIMDLTLSIRDENNVVAICGQNNVGKTNILRAMNIFFNPEMYDQKADIPALKKATWGGSVHPKIAMTFLDESNGSFLEITRDFKTEDEVDSSVTGFAFKGSVNRKRDRQSLKAVEIALFLKKISFVYIESINTLVPKLIDGISQDVLSLQFDKSRFSKDKKALKDAYDSYIDGLQEILNSFSNDISATFKSFKENWKVEFHVPKNSENFRDLISDDVTLQIQDQGSNGIEEKGSGLQRLAHILMEFEAANRMTNKQNVIICIDEPDSYLHEGLQKKLKTFIDAKSLKMQVFYTTHSKVFIDTYKLENTFLLSCKHFEQYVTRKKKDIDVIETFKIDIDTEEGYSLICNHLGIERDNYEILEKNNILVEGNSDKVYLDELSSFFKIEGKNIISVHGADNMEKYLDFYSSYYLNNSLFKPVIKVLLDNDSKGREVYKKLKAKTYSAIEVKVTLLSDFTNSANMELEKNNTNNEMEDFLYPELICYLVNIILGKKGLNPVREKTICESCKKPSFRSTGVLVICEHEKNNGNPERGNEITFISSSRATNNIKESMAGLMRIEGNKKLIALLDNCHKKYPSVKQVIKELMEFEVTS